MQNHFNIKVKLNRTILIVFQNLKTYSAHLIIQQIDKFDFKINELDMPNEFPNELGKLEEQALVLIISSLLIVFSF